MSGPVPLTPETARPGVLVTRIPEFAVPVLGAAVYTIEWTDGAVIKLHGKDGVWFRDRFAIASPAPTTRAWLAEHEPALLAACLEIRALFRRISPADPDAVDPSAHPAWRAFMEASAVLIPAAPAAAVARAEAAEAAEWDAKRRALALLAERDALRAALQRWERSGCPDCGGDCAGANPPVACCIMQETRAALASKGGE